MIRLHMTAVAAGFILDLLIGDPHFMPHPVKLIGLLVTKLERLLRNHGTRGEREERTAGSLLVILVLLITGLTAGTALGLAYWIHPYIGVVLESILCFQLLAVKSLKDESMKVHHALKEDSLLKAREAVSMIVGRDTDSLDEVGITKAAVETVAENTSDGVIAPLLYMAAGGALFGMLYKAVNTMDSMVGYKNETYLNFGRTAAKLDDFCNYIPARLAAYLMLAASFFLRYDWKNARRIYSRDRYNHKSPNSAHTEAVCAGALGIQLAGDAYYFGTLCKKPVIGDPIRKVDYDDIRKANRLLYGTSILGVLTVMLVYTVLLML